MNQYKVFTVYSGEVDGRIFKNQKSAYQYEQRAAKGWENPMLFGGMGRPITRMMKKEGAADWEQYTVIGNRLVTFSELSDVLLKMQQEANDLQASYERMENKRLKRIADAQKRQ